MPIRTLTAVEYPTSDGQPMAETDLHRKLMVDVIDRLAAHYVHRDDVYVSGNLFVYYEEGQPNRVLAPDCFVAFGVPNHPREIFQTWIEGAFPSVVFEFTSKSTRREDLSVKQSIYRDVWMVKEYFLFDPYEEYLKPSFYGLRRSKGDFETIKPVGGRIASKVLGLTMERDGKMIRFYDAATGKFLLTELEREAQDARGAAIKLEAENERLKAELEALKTKIAKNGHANGGKR